MKTMEAVQENPPLPSAEEIEQMEQMETEADYEYCGECLASVPYGLTGGEFFTETGCIYCSG